MAAEYDIGLTLEGKLAVDFAHASIAARGGMDPKWACECAMLMVEELKKRGWVKELEDARVDQR